jgi:hypothetical protein
VDEDIAREILDELFSSLETLETQSAAILRFVKDKGLASEQDLAPYFEQAGNTSNVRWRAARVRIDHLLASAFEPADRKAKEESPKPEAKNEESANKPGADASFPTQSHEENEDNSSQQKHREIARAKLAAADAVPASGGNPDQKKHTPDNAKENAGNNKTAQEKQNAGGAGSSDSVKKNAA